MWFYFLSEANRMFTRAIVRSPASNFSEGLTSADRGAGLGKPQFERAVEQHAAYCVALAQCGLTLTRLPPDPNYPDSTFVEDTAILTERCAVITRPGALSRRGEVTDISSVVAGFYPNLLSIQEPGTLDGGDVCQTCNHFFVGLSQRTNEAGGEQLAEFLAPFGYTSSFVDIRKIDSLLHLKSGLAYLGDNRLVVTEGLGHEAFPDYELIRVNSNEEYAANCIRVNDHVLLAAGYQSFARTLRELGYQTIALDMSEFQKMDGGLSCLSLRF
jgi:dimethylargininase